MGPVGWAIIAGIGAAFVALTVKLAQYKVEVESTINSTRQLTDTLGDQSDAVGELSDSWSDYAESIKAAAAATPPGWPSPRGLAAPGDILPPATPPGVIWGPWIPPAPTVTPIPGIITTPDFPAGITGPIWTPKFQGGGVMPFTGFAHIEKGETILPTQGGRPAIQNIIHIYLDGDEVTNTVIDRIAEKMRLQGVF